MTAVTTNKPAKSVAVRKWLRRGFLAWAVVSTLWLLNSYRTQGVAQQLLQDSPAVTVEDRGPTLALVPASAKSTALVFICGAGVGAEAYVPLLRPIAEAGHPVYIIRLPYRLAPLESHKQEALARVRAVIQEQPQVEHWVLSGHSLGGALACQLVKSDPRGVAALVLAGTTHPKQDDLSFLTMPVMKIYATTDGVAPPEQVLANRHLLPEHTKFVAIDGGNHSQFGHYGRQLLDGSPTIDRDQQQALVRAALLKAIAEVRE